MQTVTILGMGNILKNRIHVRMVKVISLLALAILVLPAHSRSQGKRNKAESSKYKAINWEITNIKESDEEVSELTFKRHGNGSDESEKIVKVLDDDGILTLTAIQHSIMQDISDKIVDGDGHWSVLKREDVETFSRFKDTILSSLEKVKKYDTQTISDFNLELKKLSRKQRLSREDSERVVELMRLIRVLNLEKQHADYIYNFMESRDEISAEDMSRTLGKFLMTFGNEHAHETIKESGDTEVVKLFDSNSKNALAKALTGRPIWILGDDIKIREPRTSINFASNVIAGAEPATKHKHKKLRSDDDEEESEVTAKPERVVPSKSHGKVLPELDLSDLDD